MTLRDLRVGCVVLALSTPSLSLPAQQRTRIQLPKPSGQFQVGRVSFDWTDEKRIDALAPGKGTKRELTVWIWYPASLAKSSVPAEYLPANWRNALTEHLPAGMRSMYPDLALVRGHSFERADLAKGNRRFPVIIVKPGIGTLALEYSALCEDLASHGYVVAASDSPFNTTVVVYSDGRIVAARQGEEITASKATALVRVWIDDDRFLVDRLAALSRRGTFRGRLDMSLVGAFGHSFGGATAAEFCCTDARCKAGLDIDGRPFGQVAKTGSSRPLMFLMSDHTGDSDPEGAQISRDLGTSFERSSTGRRYVTLAGSGHFSFSDLTLLMKLPTDQRSGPFGKIDARRGLQVAMACIRAFFDVNLKGADRSLLDRLSSRYPELRIGIGPAPSHRGR